MAQLNTDAEVLAKGADNFERIAGELKNILARVESTAAEMDSHWQGTAAQAAQSAIRRFHDAANAHVQQLNDISNNVHAASAKYTATDHERAGALTSAMGSAMGGPNGQATAAPTPAGPQVHPAMASTASGDGLRGVTESGVWRHGNDAPNPVQFVDFKQGPGPAPAPTPVPGPPVTGDPVRLPPRSTMNTSPPQAMGPPAHDPAKHHCGPDDIAIDTTEAAGGAAGIASGIAGEVPTAAGSTAIVVGGLSALGDAVKKLSECE